MMGAGPLRLLMIAPSERMVGGQSRQAAALRERLAGERDIEVEFLSIDQVHAKWLFWVQRIPVVRTILNEMLFLGKLPAAVARADVLHVFSASYWSYLLHPLPAQLIGKLRRRKVILNYHSGEAADHLLRFRLTAAPTMRILPDAVVVPSSYLEREFARHDVTAMVIGNAVDITRYHFRARAALEPKFLANRALEPLYNVQCIVRAFAIIQRECPSASLTIAGDGSEREQLEQIVRSLNLRDVTFVGSISQEQMTNLYDQAEVYLNSPNVDNMPLSLIECGASGLPIVSTSTGGIPHMVTNEATALLVEENDHAALAAAALRLIHDPALASRLSNGARELVEASYVWESVLPQWTALYTRLAAAGRGRA